MKLITTREAFYAHALSFWDTPYLWGGDLTLTRPGLDCSGLIQKILEPLGLDPAGDQTAHALYLHFLKNGKKCDPQFGAIVFFGRIERIHHVGMCLDEKVFLNAAGGDSGVTSIPAAKRLGASTKIQPLTYHRGQAACIMPAYPWLS